MDVDNSKQQPTVMRVTRRRLLVGAAGAVAVAGGAGLWLTVGKRLTDQRFRNAVDRGDAFAPSVYLAVQPDGEVVIWLTRSEMGQGVATALPLIIAEELDADWSRVRVEQAVADARYDYGLMTTVASSSVSSQWIELRRAGAAARQMLIASAARQWGVRASACGTEPGRVVHPDSGRSAAYGELAQSAARQRPPLRPRLKSPENFRLLGASQPRLDLPDKVTGRAVYGLDARVDGMVFAAIARSPTLGGRPTSVDDTQARILPGVQDVFAMSAGIAVIAEDSWTALRGRDALRIQWQAGEGTDISDEAIADRLREHLHMDGAGVARDDGNVLAMLTEASPEDVRSAVYEVPFVTHAPLEPMNCIAWVRDGRCEVWAPTQVPGYARHTAASVSQLPLDRVTVHTTLLGGGFGRRASSDFVAEAVELAIAAGLPVQVIWSREDDTLHGLHRDAAAQLLEAVVDANGMPRAWRHRVAHASPEPAVAGRVNPVALMGAEVLPYTVGAMRVESITFQAPVRTTIWRSVGHSYTAFAIESFIDEIAIASGADPLQWRLDQLHQTSRLRRCVERVGELSDWRRRSGLGGELRWLGVAAVECFGSYSAQVVELINDGNDGFRLEHVWCVADCGVIVHPDTVVAQLEGGILYGLGAALFGHVPVRHGAVQGGNFDEYRVLRMSEAPPISIELISSGESPGGVGELGVPPIAPALANALYAARGLRVRRLPLAHALRH